jgi:MFS family permease
MRSSDVEYLATRHPAYMKAVERNYRVNFLLLTLDSAFYTFTMAMLSQDTILPFLVTRLSGRSLLVGLVPALYFLGNFFPQLIGAYLANQMKSRKWQIFWIAVVQRLGILMIALTLQNVEVLSRSAVLALFFISYAFFTTANGIIGPAYADFTSKAITRRRGLFYGVSYGLGGLVGFGASALASRLLNTQSFPHNLQLLFWLGFGASFASPFLMASFREVTYPEEVQAEPLGKFLGSIFRQVRAYPIFLRYILTRALIGLAFMGNAFYAVYAMQRFALKEGSLGIFTMIILLSQSLLGFVWGWIGDRYGYKKVLLAASVFLGLEAVIALWAGTSVLFFGVAFLVGGVYAAAYIADPNMVFEIAPPHETSRFIGIANTFLGPVYAAAPLLGGLLVERLSHQALFFTVLGTAVIALLATSIWMVEPRKVQAVK